MANYIFIRGLKRVDFSVFAVTKGQKTYFEPQFGKYLPYSAGQQVKRSILEAMLDELNEPVATVDFYWQIKKDKKTLKQGEAISMCDPRYADQMIGGWMMAKSNKAEGADSDEEDEESEDVVETSGGDKSTVKRRSPLSISALRPLHPFLANLSGENLTFDRSDRPDRHKIIVRDFNGNVMSNEKLEKFLKDTNHVALSPKKWVPDQKGSNSRATGLFAYDIAIDLRTLFCVSLSNRERELSDETIEVLKSKGWKESKNVFGACLVCPKERREQIIPALAKALINWRITTNQARTYSPQDTLAVAISENANRLAGTIRAKLIEDEDNRAKPIVDENIPDTNVYVTLAGAGYVQVHSETYDALDRAEVKLIELLTDFDYENQITPAPFNP